ncbi:sterol carrier protein 2 [Gonapodya sp. JEL0774]|nr:sterol carrier protein 2 [Gonapodya sp. JEL0774]
MSGKGRKVYIIGVGMTKFEKPFSRKGAEYFDYSLEAATKALLDANITYDKVEFAAVGYCFGSTAMGQRSLYQLGLNQIPIVNTNNACASGSTAIYLARSQIEGGLYDCTLALGFEKMMPGPLGGATPNVTRGNPMGPMMERMEVQNTQLNPQIFGNAGIEYIKKYAKNGATDDHLNMVAEKNHRHSELNPYSQFQDVYTLDQVKKSRKIFGPVTLLQCCPTSDGAGCVILASEDFVRRHGLGAQAVEIAAQVMATDSPKALLDEERSAIELAGADMTRRAASEAFKIAKTTPDQVGVVELHDCFAPNELITYDALGIAPVGEAHNWLARGEFTHGGKVVVNPSGGLISKGHPLGATGLAQMCELTWQVRGWCGKRQIPNLKYALQHNVGLGGAVVVGLYKKADFADEKDPKWQDPRERFGYNPAVEARRITEADFKRVVSIKGGVAGTKDSVRDDVRAQL